MVEATEINTKPLETEKSNKSPVNSPVEATKKPRSGSVDLSKQIHLQNQFMDDERIGTSWIFQFFVFWQLRLAQWFHGYKFVGTEKLPEGGALMVGFHSTHNQDIAVGITGTYDATGRVPRGLLHRIVFLCWPWVSFLGLVPGQRKTAVQLLKKGFLVGVLPGGGEEAMYGHEHAYDLHPRWNDRKGFATVAKEAGVPIVPLFTKNVEEMRFNLIFWICNIIGLTRLYARTLEYLAVKKAENPKSKGWRRAHWFLKQCGLMSWFTLSWILSFWVPVQVTCFVGDPIYFDKDEDVNVIAAKTKEALQKMIDEHQPHGHSYWPGLVERYNNIFPANKEYEVVDVAKKTN